MPEELAQLGRQVLARNRDVCWRYRNAWHSALPIAGAERLVDRPWDGTEVDPACAQPSVMLRAEFRVVPYCFRETELRAFLDWCEARPRMAVSYLEAFGGAGKTRFAIEACLAVQARGWLAGLLPKQDRGADDVSLPRLLIVDYVEERAAVGLAERLAALDRSATEMAPVRVLLLSRTVAGVVAGRALESLKEVTSGAVLGVVETAKDRSSAAAGLMVAERQVLFDAARTKFGQTWYGSGWAPVENTQPDFSADQYARPLDVLLEAYDAALSGSGRRPGGKPPIDRALDHEIRHWRSRMPDIDPAVLIRCVALVTLAGERDDPEAEILFNLSNLDDSVLTLRDRLDQWLRGLYHGPDRWNPLRPDRLGEALITRALRMEPDGGKELLAAVLRLPSDAQLEQVLEVLTRLTVDATTENTIAVAIAQHHGDLVGRCAKQATGTSQRPGRTMLLDVLTRLHTKLLDDRRVAEFPLSLQLALSSSADSLGDLARMHGLSTRALLIFQGAFEIDKRKTELEPANTTYRRDLSISYERLADLAHQAGNLEIARDFVDRAITIRRAMHRLEPHRLDVAVEFGYTLYLSALITTSDEQEKTGMTRRQELISVLAPFEPAGLLTGRGQGLLAWARGES